MNSMTFVLVLVFDIVKGGAAVAIDMPTLSVCERERAVVMRDANKWGSGPRWSYCLNKNESKP